MSNMLSNEVHYHKCPECENVWTHEWCGGPRYARSCYNCVHLKGNGFAIVDAFDVYVAEVRKKAGLDT